MKHVALRLAVAAALAGVAVIPAVSAQETAKPLPTLLIKGEVVSVDTADPAATLLKVKDRYGFETPIYLTQETKIAQGDQTVAAADLKAGTAVEVEYNFDINTAKRHAVNVTLSSPSSTASAAAPEAPPALAAPEAAPAAPEAAPAVPETPAAPEAPVVQQAPAAEVAQ